METTKMLKLGFTALMMVMMAALTVPLSSQFMKLMNVSDTFTNVVGLFLLMSLYVVAFVAEVKLYKQFVTQLNNK
jgi:hypothetical protein